MLCWLARSACLSNCYPRVVRSLLLVIEEGDGVNTCKRCGKQCVGREFCRTCFEHPDKKEELRKKRNKTIWTHACAYIYELQDPDTGQVRYVGCSEHPRRRLTTHKRTASIETSRKAKWIEELAIQGKSPSLKVVKKIPYDQRWVEEQKYIQSLLDAGVDLLNVVVYNPKMEE